jgi:hypothetical protein
VLDNWQLSGENAFVSGDWAPVILATTDNFDFTGGDGGTGTDVGGGVRVVRADIVGDPTTGDRDLTPGAPGSWLNWSAFARPSGRGDYGDAPRYVFQQPGITARFNGTGEQVNLNFGDATTARNPRIMQGSMGFGF